MLPKTGLPSSKRLALQPGPVVVRRSLRIPTLQVVLDGKPIGYIFNWNLNRWWGAGCQWRGYDNPMEAARHLGQQHLVNHEQSNHQAA